MNWSCRLDDDCQSLSKWLTNQEEKWKEKEPAGEKTVLFYQALTRKRYGDLDRNVLFGNMLSPLGSNVNGIWKLQGAV